MQELKTSFKSEGPFLAGTPFPIPHTLFIVADKRMEMKHLIGQGNKFTMSFLLDNFKLYFTII